MWLFLDLPFFVEDFVTYKQQLWNTETLFERECTNMKLGDINMCIAIGELRFFSFFLKAAYVMISLSNKCISLIRLEHYKLTWQPNVPNASGVGLFWDKKYPLELPYSILKQKILIWGKYKRSVGKELNF